MRHHDPFPISRNGFGGSRSLVDLALFICFNTRDALRLEAREIARDLRLRFFIALYSVVALTYRRHHDGIVDIRLYLLDEEAGTMKCQHDGSHARIETVYFPVTQRVSHGSDHGS